MNDQELEQLEKEVAAFTKRLQDLMVENEISQLVIPKLTIRKVTTLSGEQLFSVRKG